MQSFLSWLNVEPKGVSHVRFLIRATLFSLLYAICFAVIFRQLFGDLPDAPSVASMREKSPLYILTMLVIFCMAEELVFRYPLALLLEKNARPTFVFGAAILMSVCFGYLHGGFINILIQGVGGFWLCLVFIKCGGARKRFTKALLSTYAVHLAYDLVAFTMIFLDK